MLSVQLEPTDTIPSESLEDLRIVGSFSFAGDASGMVSIHVGDKFTITTEVNLGILAPSEVSVEVYHGNVSSDNLIAHSMSDVMEVAEERGNGQYLYSYKVTCKKSGRYGFTVKVVPVGDSWKHTMPGFITWPAGS